MEDQNVLPLIMSGRITILFLLLLAAPGNGIAQPTGGTIYKPSDCRTCLDDVMVDSVAPLRKSLVLADDGWFSYIDRSGGSCWLWLKVSGTWALVNDTVVFSWYDHLFPDSVVKITRYVMSGSKLYYSDPQESNIVVNWGEFTLLQTKPDLLRILPHEGMLKELAAERAFQQYMRAQDKVLTLSQQIEAHNILLARPYFTEEELVEKKWCRSFSKDDIRYILSFYPKLD